MARKEAEVEELVEILHQWHMGRSKSQIKRSVGMDRKTITKYIEIAEGCGFFRDMEPQGYRYYLELSSKVLKEMKTPIESSTSYKTTASYQNTIDKLMIKPYMKPKQVYRLLIREYDYSLSYSSFNRYMNIKYPKQFNTCLRIEVSAAEEAQVDFGSAGMMFDSEEERMRRAHCFVMSLSYSRLHYVEFVFDQGQITWVKCHINAFEFFGGVVKRVVLDNLKSGVLRPNTYDPVFNRAYAECAKHYGFIIDPNKIGMAAHKGKVERKIPVVRQQFLSSYDFRDIRDANKKAKGWCLDGYGMEMHGTTKRMPYEVFKQEEQHLLGSLPIERFDIPLWKEARVHPDHHVVFDKGYYSVPHRFVHKKAKVWVRGGLYNVHIFYDNELIKTHQRSYRPGTWSTDEGDYPPEKSRYLLKTTSYYQEEALKYGEHVKELVKKIMEEHAYRNLRKVQGIFRLAERYGSEALDQSCKRCLYYEDYRMSTIKRVLDKGLYRLPAEDEHIKKTDNTIWQGRLSFIRDPKYFNHTMEDTQ